VSDISNILEDGIKHMFHEKQFMVNTSSSYYLSNFLVSNVEYNVAGLLIASTSILGLAHAPLVQVVSTG
jgi:hypothetical protein